MTRKPVTEVPDAQSDPRFMGGWAVAGTEARKRQWNPQHYPKHSQLDRPVFLKKTKINPEYSDDYFKRRKP